jgi:hypothetical protein
MKLQEVRKGKYGKTNSSSKDVMYTVAELGLPVEGTANSAGVTLLVPAVVLALLQVGAECTGFVC